MHTYGSEEQQKANSSETTSQEDCEDDSHTTECAIRTCTRFSSPITFLAIVVPLYTVIIAASTYLGGCISTIEKQFQLSSSQSGMISTVNDVVSLSLVIFATHYGSKCHRARVMCISAMTIGLGYFVLSIPHFISEPKNEDSQLISYNNNITINEASSINNKLCSPGDVKQANCVSSESTEDQPFGVIWLILGQILVGVGSAPMFPLVITYLDDSTVDSNTTSIYIAVLFMALAFGPSIGFATSFKCLSLYVDFYRVDKQSIPTNPKDPRWIGAWWLGFVVIGVLSVIFSVPLYFFPRKLKKYECTCCQRRESSEKLNKEFSVVDVYTAEFIQDKGKGIIANVIELIKAMKRIITNPTIVFLKLETSVQFAIIGGFSFFIAKYVEKQFAVSASTASIILGAINLPASVFGNISSSFCVKKLDLTKCGLSKMLVALAGVSLMFAVPLLFIGCSNPHIAGVTINYNASHSHSKLPDANSICNADCACLDRIYEPVCSSNGVTYVSACYAGCSGILKEEKNDLTETLHNDTMFFDCSCIATDAGSMGGIAKEGACDWSCNKILPFAILIAFVSVFSAMRPNPSLLLSLRCVDPEDRALSVAFGMVMLRVLGFFPAPIYFGVAIANTCLVRQESCSRDGACLVYDLESYRYSYIGLFVALKLLAVLFGICIYVSISYGRWKKSRSNPVELVSTDIVRQQPTQNDIASEKC